MKNNNLEVQELSWKPEKGKKQVLEEVSVLFKQGGFYALLGPNGSGKTSFMRHIMRFLPIQSGGILLKEKELSQYARKELAKSIAFVPQNTNIDTSFLAYDIIAMGRNPYRRFMEGISAADKSAIEYAVQVTGCKSLLQKRFSNLSGGEAQRVIIARAIAQNTPWLILDEPVAHLDVRYQVETMKTLQELNEKKNISIIIVLHDINLAAAYCKTLVLMKDGKIFASGQKDEVLTQENLKEVYGIEFSIIKDVETGASYYVAI